MKKTVVIFATLIIVEAVVFFTTGYWLPGIEYVLRIRQDVEEEIVLIVLQFLLFCMTLVSFVVALIMAAVRRKAAQEKSNFTISNEEKL